MDLTNSKRVLLSANHVTIALTREQQDQLNDEPGRALEKLNFLRQLSISMSELMVAVELVPEGDPSSLRECLDILRPLITGLEEESDTTGWNPQLARDAVKIPYKALRKLAGLLAE